MNENETRALYTAPEITEMPAASLEERPESKASFTTSLPEKILAWLIFPLSYLYVRFCSDADGLFGSGELPLFCLILFVLFVLGFFAFGEVLHFRHKRQWESLLFLGLTLALLSAFTLNVTAVWSRGHLFFFLHLFASYALMLRGERLAERHTSHMFLWDGISTFFVLPFKNFPLVFRTIASCFRRKSGSKASGVRTAVTVLAVLISFALLIIAVALLRKASPEFENTVAGILNRFYDLFDSLTFFRIFLTVTIGAYLYGMLGGSYREKPEDFVRRGNNIKLFLEKLKKIPVAVWLGVIALFSVFYVLFFVLQSRDFVNTFILNLPNGTTYSAFAVTGFAEMCGVMLVNFVLLWLVTRTTDKPSPALIAGGLVLLLENLLFALVAALRMFMYINAYGFTPLRLQSAWLIVSLTYGCVLWAVALLSGKSMSRAWFIGSAALLAAVTFIP